MKNLESLTISELCIDSFICEQDCKHCAPIIKELRMRLEEIYYEVGLLQQLIDWIDAEFPFYCISCNNRMQAIDYRLSKVCFYCSE